MLTLRHIDPSSLESQLNGKPGQPLVWPGQFVFGYPTQLAKKRLQPGPIADGGAPWMVNGSFLVFRRLRQEVDEFKRFTEERAEQLSRDTGKDISAQLLMAMIVGRWEDGTPLVANPLNNEPGLALDDMRINYFQYRSTTPDLSVRDRAGGFRSITGTTGDESGQRCPFFSHIRKVNPRDLSSNQGDAGVTLTFQMLRRGIPFENCSPGGQSSEKGLLFLAYQSSIKRQFMLLNRDWINNPSAPEIVDEGHDMLIGQNYRGDRFSTLRDANKAEIARISASPLSRWVIPTGGGFFFAPSLSFIRQLRNS